MANPAVQSLLKKIGDPDLVRKLTKELTSSELNSLLLEVFRHECDGTSPQDVMDAYKANRFVTPSSVDALAFARLDLLLLESAHSSGFETLELSPLAPLGNCSAISLTNQNKVVSSVRGTEVVADATNLMALESSVRRVKSGFDDRDVHLACVHRHVRAQAFSGKGFTAHFKIFCALTAGKDTGNLDFEKRTFLRHMEFYAHLFAAMLKPGEVKIMVKGLSGEGGDTRSARAIFEHTASRLKGVDVSFHEVSLDEHRYYQHTRFSLNILFKGTEYNLGDGGFVDWGQKLTSNNKERLFTSGIGIELLLKLQQGQI